MPCTSRLPSRGSQTRRCRSWSARAVREALTRSGLGVAIGLIGAVAASRALITLLFGVSRLDPATYLGVIVLLLAVSVIACSVPAGRAARVDPSITLRAE